jgi:protein phosphatase
MRIREYAGLSDVGSVRGNNEDRWLADPEAGLFVVADGLGGHAAGEVAAQRAVDELPRLLASRRQSLAAREDPQVARTLAAVLRALNRKIFQEAQANATHRGMGTTVVFVLVLDDIAIVANVGDCRAYLHREGRLRQLTHDHSLAQYLLDNAMVNADDPRLPFARRQLLQHVGMATPPLPWLHKLPLVPDDRLLLCSDGLTDMVADEEIAGVLGRELRVRAAGAELIDMAKLAGGRDNITAVLADFME